MYWWRLIVVTLDRRHTAGSWVGRLAVLASAGDVDERAGGIRSVVGQQPEDGTRNLDRRRRRAASASVGPSRSTRPGSPPLAWMSV